MFGVTFVLGAYNVEFDGGKVVMGGRCSSLGDEWFITWWCVVHHLVVSGSSLGDEWFITWW